ncbi:Ribosomal-protein-alanine acetyltransferase [Roseobacter sp. AzwK-3b]|uniref:ATP-binding protein n=1 Tax=Roseobacter sp. AzwK-3b TaxID=351016 RepID=UPI000156ACB4|nr:ATP-binding protein [Roseobacter sp. AzwK-3b]EDM69979.1 Ribosomal-protein-alanine acetyltransferase [Roseobacter sp. AzwK-3b]
MSAHANTPEHTLPELSGSAAKQTRIKGWVWPLQQQIALMVLAAILVFALVIQLWNYRTFMNTEIERTQEKHLVIAQNVSLSLSRYVTDVARVFAHAAIEVGNNNSEATRVAHMSLLESLNVESMALLPTFAADQPPPNWLGKNLPLPEQTVLDDLRAGTNATLGGVQISGLQRIGDGKHFILGYELPDQRLVIGYMRTDYIKAVQRAIAFGEFGHSAIFDQFGRAIAHPSPKVEENMVDASGISAVRRMLNRETGVEMFFSPPMQMDMIAGITFVPETGWPVMVPQPIYELSEAVNGSLSKSYLLAVVVAALLGAAGWAMSRRLARPVRHFTEISSKISDGDYTITLPDEERSSTEMWQLNEALKTMIRHVRSSDKKLREALRLEEEENKRKSDFLVIAGHELRTPLSGVVGMLTICREQTDDADRDRYLDVAWSSAKELNALVDHMVDFAEGTTGSIRLDPVTFDIEARIREIEALYGNLAQTAGLEFRRAGLGDGSTQIVSDPARISQMISKVLENAIKFTKEGSITLHSEILQQDDRKWLKVKISDTGIGIDETQLERIFMPFEQVESSFTRSYRGMGIGLSVAQAIATKFGGHITCASKVHEGTRFEIWTPIELA